MRQMAADRPGSRVWLSGLGLLGFCGLWQLIGAHQWLGSSFPTLTSIVSEIFHDRVVLTRAITATTRRAAEGYVVGVLVATLCATLLVWIPRLEVGTHRFAVIINAFPVIALGPLFESTKLRPATSAIFAGLAVYFTTLITVADGYRATPATSHDVFSSYGASRWSRFTRLQLPCALPAFADALKIAAPAAVLGAILGEWYGADRGLGILMISGMQNFRITLLWAAAALAIIISAVSFFILGAAERAASSRFARTVERDGAASSGVRSSGVRNSGFRALDRRRGIPVGTLGSIVVVLAWAAWITTSHVPQIVAPSPAGVAARLIHHPGAYLAAAGHTLESALGGLVIGMFVGVALAVIVSTSDILSGLVAPLSLVIPSVPIVVIIPVVARLIGYSSKTVLITAILMAFFPVFVLVASGLRSRPPGADDVFATYGAPQWRQLWHLALPSAMPNLLIAVRISAATCFLGALSAEWLIGQNGLGHLFSQNRVLLETQAAWGAIIVAIALSVITYRLAEKVGTVVEDRWL
jgi:sulfonate transport system permease protein